MTTLNGLVGIVFNYLDIVASTSLSSMWLFLIHQFETTAKIANPPPDRAS